MKVKEEKKPDVSDISEEIKLLSNWRMQGLQLIAKRVHTLLFSQSMLLTAYGLVVFTNFVTDETDKIFYGVILAMGGSVYAIALGLITHQYYKREWFKVDNRLEKLYPFFKKISDESREKNFIPTWLHPIMFSCMQVSFWVLLIVVLIGGLYLGILTVLILALILLTIFIRLLRAKDYKKGY